VNGRLLEALRTRDWTSGQMGADGAHGAGRVRRHCVDDPLRAIRALTLNTATALSLNPPAK
jgi:hypothetical protein